MRQQADAIAVFEHQFGNRVKVSITPPYVQNSRRSVARQNEFLQRASDDRRSGCKDL